jgi:hypothetical protein
LVAQPALTRWERLPVANRQRLLHLLTRLVERQLLLLGDQDVICGEEGRHDAGSDQ